MIKWVRTYPPYPLVHLSVAKRAGYRYSPCWPEPNPAGYRYPPSRSDRPDLHWIKRPSAAKQRYEIRVHPLLIRPKAETFLTIWISPAIFLTRSIMVRTALPPGEVQPLPGLGAQLQVGPDYGGELLGQTLLRRFPGSLVNPLRISRELPFRKLGWGPLRLFDNPALATGMRRADQWWRGPITNVFCQFSRGLLGLLGAPSGTPLVLWLSWGPNTCNHCNPLWSAPGYPLLDMT